MLYAKVPSSSDRGTLGKTGTDILQIDEDFLEASDQRGAVLSSNTCVTPSALLKTAMLKQHHSCTTAMGKAEHLLYKQRNMHVPSYPGNRAYA